VPTGTPPGVTVNVPPVTIDVARLETDGVGGWALIKTLADDEDVHVVIPSVTV
jgi:hypothetical protein